MMVVEEVWLLTKPQTDAIIDYKVLRSLRI